MALIDRASQPGTVENYVHQDWPAWRYGPEGRSEIFEREDDVPDGWEDHPSKVGGAQAPRQKQEGFVSPYKDDTDAEILEKLKSRKIDFNAKWPRQKLEMLLIEADKKA